MKTKTRCIAIASTALLAILLLSAWTTTSRRPRSLARSRHRRGRVRVVPDEVILSLGVETWTRASRGQERNDEIVKRVVALAAGTASSPSMSRPTIWASSRATGMGITRARLIGYLSTRRSSSPARPVAVEEVLSASLEPAPTMCTASNSHTELRQHRDQARALAIKRPRKAVPCRELGSSGRPLTIQEEQGGWWSSYGPGGAAVGRSYDQNVIQE